MMDIETEKAGIKATARLDKMRGELSFSKVGLRYTSDTDPVFSGLSFDLKPGQILAVTGGNGSGKSTILKLINGLYNPQVGAISIDGIDIRQLNPQELRRQISYMPQSPRVFRGTIAENLRMADPLADENGLVQLSQVDVATEMTDLIVASRHYQMNLRVVTAAEEAYEAALQIGRR